MYEPALLFWGSSAAALTATFLLSIAVHELLVWAALTPATGASGVYRPWLAGMSLAQLPLYALSRHDALRGKRLGNSAWRQGTGGGRPDVPTALGTQSGLAGSGHRREGGQWQRANRISPLPSQSVFGRRSRWGSRPSPSNTRATRPVRRGTATTACTLHPAPNKRTVYNCDVCITHS